MAKIKAAVFDVDGTLYDYHDQKIHQSTIDAINHLKSKGIKIVIASARVYSELSEDCISRVAADYYVGASGHCIQDRSGRPIYSERFTYEQTEHIKNLAVQHGAGLTLKYEKYSYIYQRPDKMEHLYSNIGALRCPIYICKDMNHHQDELPLGFAFYGENGTRDRIAEDLKQHTDEYRFEMFGNGVVGEIYSPYANKMTALKHLVDRLGITHENIVAFGDGPNDIEMIKWAGIGVAMGNGREVLKASADVVCGNSWEDGISKYVFSLSL